VADGAETEEPGKADGAGAAASVEGPERVRSHHGGYNVYAPRETEEEGHPYLTSRIASRTGQLAGARKISMLSSGLATLGLGFLKKRGREKTGAALLATAAGLALLKRR
jgi:hypothetical protein